MKLWPFSRPGGNLVKAIEEAPEQKAPTTFSLSSLFLSGGDIVAGSNPTQNAYYNSWIAYSCIKRLANDASGIPFLFLSDPLDPDSGVPDSHPTKQLFMNPSPYFSTGELKQWLITMLNMRGEFFLTFDDPMRPTEMFPSTDPLHWKEHVTGVELEGWEYQNSGYTMLRAPGEIVHHAFIDPSRPFRGRTPIGAASMAYGIETGADRLTQNIVKRGGEKSAIYTSEQEVTTQQRDQVVQMLRGRRAGNASVSKDVLLPNGVKPLDPKFIEDDTMILEAGGMQPDKICSVFGVPKSLLGFGSEEKYSNAAVRKRTYFEDTLVPMLTGITDAFDRYFVNTLTSKYHCYVRFDWAAVPAMQDNIAERFKMAAEANKAGIPWAVLNERFELGLATENIPGADTIMVSSSLAPLEKLIDEWNNPAPVSPTPSANGANEPGKAIKGDDGPRLTNALIRKRAKNTRNNIQRGIRILRMEKEFKAQWRTLLQKHMNKAVKLAGRIEEGSDAKAVLSPAFSGLGEAMGKVASPHHEDAAKEGQKSIVDLVEGKMSDAENNAYKATFQWAPGVSGFLKQRTNFVVGMEDPIFADVVKAVEETIIGGAEVSEVQHVIRARFGSAPGGINRAVTIARTEVGTAYNTARFSEMKNQDFEYHEWHVPNDDGEVRESHINALSDGSVKVGEDFPSVGMPHPQYDGGPPEEVINCRCETLPVLKG